MGGTSLSAGKGNAREWRLPHLLYLAAAAIILFVIVFWSALGLPPFSGITVEWVLGGIFIGSPYLTGVPSIRPLRAVRLEPACRPLRRPGRHPAPGHLP